MDQASIDDLVSQIPIGQLAAQLGVDEETADSAVRSAIPALLGGLAANAQDPGGAASLQNALAQHANDPLDLSAVDVADGEKIVHHIYGDNTDEVVSRLGGLGGDSQGGGGGLMKMLLPLLAPLIMGWLAKKTTGGQAAPGEGGGGGLGGMLDSLGGGSGGGGGDLGDLLGSVTGSGSGGGGGLGDLLGGMFGGGGGGSSNDGPDIGDLLGDLLGGGTKG